MDEQLQALTTQLAELTSAPAEVWAHVALPVAVAINALNAGGGAPKAEPSDHPLVLARQLNAALRRRRELTAA